MASDFLAGEEDHDLKDKGESAMRASLAHGDPRGYEVGYGAFAINGRMLGHGDPIRVQTGQRVLLHVLNGSATETPVLWLGAAERISAIVDMTTPGVWVLGDLSDDDRGDGMGVVVEYAARTGDPRWAPPPPFTWDYRLFTPPNPAAAAAPDHTIEMLIEKRNAADNGFNVWTINGTPFSIDTNNPMLDLQLDKRYRLRFRNATDDLHPMHLHRHTFEITHIAGTPTAGVRKDVAMLGGYQTMEVDFLADQPGLSLLHCHQQIHMDYGLMTLLNTT